MADYSVKAILSAVDSGFSSGIEGAIAKVKSLSGTISTMRSSVSKSMDLIGNSLTVGGAAVTALGTKSLQSFGDFQTNLNKAAVVAGGTSKDIGGLSDVANKMGRDLPISANDAAKAMVGMAQNGAGLNTLKRLFPAIAKASTAAGADLGKTANAVQQSYNIWGGSAEQNAAILVQTANQSNASIDTMSDAFANVGTTAKSLNLSLGTTAEAIGLLTNKGMTTERASMDLNHALVQMIKPSNAAKNVMQALGISYTDANGKMKPFRDILGELSEKLGQYTPQQQKAYLATMYGTAGMQAIAPLIDSVRNKTNDASVSWDAYARKQQQAAGTTQLANKTLDTQAKEMQKNVGSALEQVGGSWDDLKNTSMQANNTILQSTLHTISSIIGNLQTAQTPVAQLVRSLIGLSPLLGPLMTGLGGTFKALSAFAGLNPVVQVLALISGALSAIYISSPQARTALQGFVKSLNPGAIMAKVKALTQQVTQGFNIMFKTINSNTSFKALSSSFNALFKSILNLIKQIIKAIPGLGATFNKIKKPADIWKLLGQYIANIANHLVSIMKRAAQAINALAKTKVVNKIVKDLVSIFNDVVKAIKRTISIIGSFIKGFLKATSVRSLWNQIYSIFKNVLKTIKNLIIVVAKCLFGMKNTKKAKNSWETLGKAVGVIIKNLLKAIQNTTKLFYDMSKNKIALAAIKALVVAIGGFIIIQKVIKLVTFLVSVFWKVVSVIKTVISVVKDLKAALTLLWVVMQANPVAAIITVFSALVAGLVYFFTKTKTGRKLWHAFCKGLKDEIDSVKKVFGKVGNWLKNLWAGLKKTFNKAKDFVKGLFDPKNWVKLGVNALQGLLNGIIGLIRKIPFVGGKIADTLTNALKDKLDIHSPSRRMAKEVGKYIIPGIVQGLDYSQIDDATAQISDRFSNISAEPDLDLQYTTPDSLGTYHTLQDMTLNMNNRPAYINLTLGGHDYQAFVSDISNEQDNQNQLYKLRGF